MFISRQANAPLVSQARVDWPISKGSVMRPLQTRLGHIAIRCWQYLQYSSLVGMGAFPGDNPLVALMTLFSHAPTEDRNQLVQEAVVDTFGLRAFVQGLQRALDDPTLLDDNFQHRP